VMIVSPDEGFLAGNPAAIEMFGCRDEQDFVSRTPASLSPEYQPDGALSVDKSLEMMRIALEKGSHSFEWTHCRADGVDFLATILLSRMEIGGRQLLQATVRDITESKRAAEVLRQFVDRLSLATRAGGVGIWDYDIIENKLIWDDQMYRLYGITQEKFGGAYEAWRSGLHPEDMQRGDDEIQMALRGEKEFDTEFRVLWPDGTIRNIRALAILQRDASGKPLRMIGTNWDITERKQAEAELEKTIQELQSALEQIRTLKGLVPICAWCKKIRNDKGYWEQVEAYVSKHTEAQFSHGICPDCMRKLYPEFCEDEKTSSK